MIPRRAVLIWVLCALLIAPLFTLTRDRQGDAPVYRTAALRFLAGEQIYRPTDAAAFSYPPFFVFAYIPFALIPQPWDRTAWCFFNLLVLGYILCTISHLIGPAIRDNSRRLARATCPTYTLIGLLSIRFLISPIEYQGHDLIVFALFVTALKAMAVEKDGQSGLWAGLAAACKATPLLLTVDFFWQRRVRAFVVTIVTVVAASLLPDLVVRNPDRPLWVQSWYDKFLSHIDAASAPEAAGAWNSWNMLNQSLSGTLYRFGTRVTEPTEYRWDASVIALSPRMLAIVTASAKILVLLLVSYAVWPASGRADSDSARFFGVAVRGSAVLLGMLLLSPMTSKQHFCVLLVPISVLVIDWHYFSRGTLFNRNLMTTLALGVLLILGMLAGKDIVGTHLHKQLNVYGSLTWLTLVVLIACCNIARRSRDRAVLDSAVATHVSTTH